MHGIQYCCQRDTGPLDMGYNNFQGYGLFWIAKQISSFLSFNLVAGITVAYSAPTRNGCLKVVENNYCASKRGMFFFPLLIEI